MSTTVIVTEQSVETTVVDEVLTVAITEEQTVVVSPSTTGPQGGKGSPGGAPDWGDIGGTIPNQADLQAELDLKASLEQATALVIALGG
jgi:hypothetical protein